jgi:Zn-dependent peptidase ImmA (M78 family)
MSKTLSTQSLIDGLLRSTGAADPFVAIRAKARTSIESYRATFGEPEMPFDIPVLASLLGIAMSNDAPAHSKDAELIPTSDGRVSIRVNRDRPETRVRFSIGHEICHTFFPNYEQKSWCRTDGRYRSRDNPDDLVEMLCDAGAAELIFPVPWFTDDAARVTSGADLVQLAEKYGASREATLRRFAELHPGCVAAVYFSWKLKPTQKKTIGLTDQDDFFDTPAELIRRAKKLRVDYSVGSEEFDRAKCYVPHDKSIANIGPIYEAAWLGSPREGECTLDLGPMKGRYRVLAVPIWTDDEHLGPEGQNSIGAILEPLDLKAGRASRTTKAIPSGSMFS